MYIILILFKKNLFEKMGMNGVAAPDIQKIENR